MSRVYVAAPEEGLDLGGSRDIYRSGGHKRSRVSLSSGWSTTSTNLAAGSALGPQGHACVGFLIKGSKDHDKHQTRGRKQEGSRLSDAFKIFFFWIT